MQGLGRSCYPRCCWILIVRWVAGVVEILRRVARWWLVSRDKIWQGTWDTWDWCDTLDCPWDPRGWHCRSVGKQRRWSDIAHTCLTGVGTGGSSGGRVAWVHWDGVRCCRRGSRCCNRWRGRKGSCSLDWRRCSCCPRRQRWRARSRRWSVEHSSPC